MAKFDPTAGPITLGISDADTENILEGYNGPDMPARTVAPGMLSRVFITSTEAGDPMLKVLYKSSLKGYEGFPVWDNVTLTPAAAFKWKPFIELLGITAEDLNSGIKCDTNGETNAGYPVYAIGPRDLENELIEVMFSVVYKSNKENPDSRWPELQFISAAK